MGVAFMKGAIVVGVVSLIVVGGALRGRRLCNE